MDFLYVEFALFDAPLYRRALSALDDAPSTTAPGGRRTWPSLTSLRLAATAGDDFGYTDRAVA